MSARQFVQSAVYPMNGPAIRWPLPPEILRAALEHGALDDVLPAEAASYAVSREVALLLAELVATGGRRNVLEFGAGSSSRVLARALSCVGGGVLTSIEQSPEWCRDAWRDVQTSRGVHAKMIVAQPKLRVGLGGIYHSYAAAWDEVAARGAYDLVFIDAPQWYYGRDGALPLIHALLTPGALLVVDDAGRRQERWTIRRWLQVYAGLELVAFNPEFGRNGIAVLRFNGDRRRRVVPSAWISSSVHVTASWMTRVVRGLKVTAPPSAATEPT